MNQETKREKFVRLAEARTNKIIDMIQLLGNCSNQSQYEYSQKDVNKIFNAIQAELDAANAALETAAANAEKKDTMLHIAARLNEQYGEGVGQVFKGIRFRTY